MSFICKNPDCTAPDNKKGKAYPSAMECPFCDVPLVEVISISEADLSLIRNLPYVIAYPLKRALLEKHPLTRINLFRDTFLNYLKYLALITASEFFNSPIKDKKMVALFNRTLTETSFGLWNEFIREALKFLNDSGHNFFCPELNDYYTSVQTGSNRKLYKGEVFVEDSFGETKIIQQKLTGIDSLINFRNRYLGHQQTLDDATYVDLWEQYFPIFQDLLTHMTFCSNYLMYKTEHGETFCLQGDEIKLRETTSQLNANVWIEDGNNCRLEILPFFVVPGELSIRKEDKEQILVYESYTGKTIKFFSPEGTEKLTSGKILERLNLLLRDKQKEQSYSPETFTKEVFLARVTDENKLTLETLISEKKVIPGVYIHRQEIEIKLKEWIGARASIFFIAAEAGSGKTNLLTEMQKQYAERGLSSFLVRAGRMEKQGLAEQIAYLLNIDYTLGLGAYPILAGTQSEPTFILIDGINEAFNAESLWKEVLELSKLFEPGSIKFVVTARTNSKADLYRYPVSEEDMNLIYGENKDRETGLAALTHWLTPQNMEEMKDAWENYASSDKARYKPQFSFDDIAGFDRTIYDQINNPLVLRIFLEVYNRKNLPKKGKTHLNIWQDWFNTFSAEEQKFLEMLAMEVWANGKNELLLDDLLKVETLKPYLISDNSKSPYQRLKDLGWISRYIKDLNVCIGFTVEGVLLYIFGKHLQKRSPKIDIRFISDFLEKGSKLQKAGIEAYLCEEALGGDLEMITKLIDADDENSDKCIRALLHYIKSYGVESTLEKLLKNPTENDWKALLRLNEMLGQLQLHVLKSELLNKVIPRIPFITKSDIKLGLWAIAEMENKEAKYYFSKIYTNLNFTLLDADILHILGHCKFRFAEYDHALDSFQSCLNNRLKNLGSDHMNVAADYNDIGVTYYRKGEYEMALEFYEKSLNVELKILGVEHPAVATSYLNIGLVWYKRGEYDYALEFYQKCLNIRLRILGSEHLEVATCYNSIGLIWDEKGDYDYALEFYQKSLDIRLNILGGEHDDVATSYNNIASALYYKGNYVSALDYYQKCQEISLRALGSEHPELAAIYNNIAFVHNSNRNYKEALSFHQKSLDIKMRILGELHPDVAISYINIGRVWSNLAELDKALEFYDKCLFIRLKTLGELHPDVATCYNEIGIIWNKKGEEYNAMNYFKKCLDIRLKRLVNGNLDVANMYLVGECYCSLNQYNKAIEVYQRCFEVSRKGGISIKIAECYEALGDKNHALNYYIQSASIRKDDPQCGLNDKSTLDSIQNCKRLAFELGEEDKLPGWMK